MTLFCTEDRCSREICSRCYLGDHKLHNVIDIDEEQEKCDKFADEINKLVATGMAKLEVGKRNVKEHYIKETYTLESFKQYATTLIDHFVQRKKSELSRNKENSLRYIEVLDAALNEAKTKVSGSGTSSSERLNATQSEKLLHSVMLKLQHVQRTGVQVTSNMYHGM